MASVTLSCPKCRESFTVSFYHDTEAYTGRTCTEFPDVTCDECDHEMTGDEVEKMAEENAKD